MSLAPVWFISHGAPDLVLREQPATRFLRTLRLGELKGLVVISATGSAASYRSTSSPNRP